MIRMFEQSKTSLTLLSLSLHTAGKGLERQPLIGLAGAAFNHAWTSTKASAPCMEARQEDYIKGIYAPLGP